VRSRRITLAGNFSCRYAFTPSSICADGSTSMFESYLETLGRFCAIRGSKQTKRRASQRKRLTVEHLESRDVPAPLAWAVGASLPVAESGMATSPAGSNLLLVGGPSATSYTLSVIDPAWRDSSTPTVQPLDLARSGPGVGPLPGGYY